MRVLHSGVFILSRRGQKTLLMKVSTGGLDDRFDLILVSQSVKDSGGITYIPGSYTTFGNDGNHLNRALNELPNAVVEDDIATALYYSSDHLPVYADFFNRNGHSN